MPSSPQVIGTVLGPDHRHEPFALRTTPDTMGQEFSARTLATRADAPAWQVLGSNQRRRSRQIYSLLPLATRATCHAVDAEARRGETIATLRHGKKRSKPWHRSSSSDIVSKVDRQEVDNALNQAAKEVRQRFDFKNTDASIAWSGESIEMEANSEERVKAVLDVFQSKLVKRGVSLKSLDAGEPPRVGQALQDHRDHPGRHHPGERQEGFQTHSRRRPAGSEGPDPGRRASGEQQEPRRPAERAGTDQGPGVRLCGPVYELSVTGGYRT